MCHYGTVGLLGSDRARFLPETSAGSLGTRLSDQRCLGSAEAMAESADRGLGAYMDRALTPRSPFRPAAPARAPPSRAAPVSQPAPPARRRDRVGDHERRPQHRGE